MDAEENIDDYGVLILNEETEMIEWVLQLVAPVVCLSAVALGIVAVLFVSYVGVKPI
jgi:hypothetical protein